jgi:hypothetical protein
MTWFLSFLIYECVLRTKKLSVCEDRGKERGVYSFNFENLVFSTPGPHFWLVGESDIYCNQK